MKNKDSLTITKRSWKKTHRPTRRPPITSIKQAKKKLTHPQRQIMGREVVVAITNGQLDFGPWEQIFYGEFDGDRRKRAWSKS